MAKKAASGFNMSAEIRELLTTDKTLGATACLEAIQKKHPKQTFNKGSFSVAFYNARNALGIKSGRKKKAASTKMVRKPTAASVDMATLQAAAKFVAQVGDADTALEAIRQVRSLQIG